MKKIFIITSVLFLASCKPTIYVGNYGQQNQTQVTLSSANFKTLGSFKGISSHKKQLWSIAEKEGLISSAKSNLLANAKANGIELTGSRTLVNVCVDVIENKKMITATVSAEIIEFTKPDQTNEVAPAVINSDVTDPVTPVVPKKKK